MAHRWPYASHSVIMHQLLYFFCTGKEVLGSHIKLVVQTQVHCVCVQVLFSFVVCHHIHFTHFYCQCFSQIFWVVMNLLVERKWSNALFHFICNVLQVGFCDTCWYWWQHQTNNLHQLQHRQQSFDSADLFCPGHLSVRVTLQSQIGPRRGEHSGCSFNEPSAGTSKAHYRPLSTQSMYRTSLERCFPAGCALLLQIVLFIWRWANTEPRRQHSQNGTTGSFINQRSNLFRRAWNNHRIRSANNRTPTQMWMDGMLSNSEQSQQLSTTSLEMTHTVRKVWKLPWQDMAYSSPSYKQTMKTLNEEWGGHNHLTTWPLNSSGCCKMW